MHTPWARSQVASVGLLQCQSTYDPCLHMHYFDLPLMMHCNNFSRSSLDDPLQVDGKTCYMISICFLAWSPRLGPKPRMKPYKFHERCWCISGISNSKSMPPNSDAVYCRSECRNTSETSHLSKQSPPTPRATSNSVIHTPPSPIPNSPLILPHELHAAPPSLLLNAHTFFSSQTLSLNMPPYNLPTLRIRSLTLIIRIENSMSHPIRPLERNRFRIISGRCRVGNSVPFPRAAKF